MPDLQSLRLSTRMQRCNKASKCKLLQAPSLRTPRCLHLSFNAGRVKGRADEKLGEAVKGLIQERRRNLESEPRGCNERPLWPLNSEVLVEHLGLGPDSDGPFGVRPQKVPQKTSHFPLFLDSTWRLLCSSLLAMTCSGLQKNSTQHVELHRSLQVGVWLRGATPAPCSFAESP